MIIVVHIGDRVYRYPTAAAALLRLGREQAAVMLKWYGLQLLTEHGGDGDAVQAAIAELDGGRWPTELGMGALIGGLGDHGPPHIHVATDGRTAAIVAGHARLLEAVLRSRARSLTHERRHEGVVPPPVVHRWVHDRAETWARMVRDAGGGR